MNQMTTTNENKTVAIPNKGTTSMLATDVIIPRLLLMQGPSDFVKARKAQMGDIVSSVGAKKLGDPETMVDFIVLSEPVPTWIEEIQQVGSQRYKFKRIVPRTAKNTNDEWYYFVDKDGNEVSENSAGAFKARRVQCLSTYILLEKSIEEFYEEKKKAMSGNIANLDLSKALTPFLVTFRSTSLKAGKEINTYLTSVAQFRANPTHFSIKLGCALETKNSDTYYVFTIDRSAPKPIKNEYVEDVDYWASIVKTQNLRVDETEDGSAEDAVDVNELF